MKNITFSAAYTAVKIGEYIKNITLSIEIVIDKICVECHLFNPCLRLSQDLLAQRVHIFDLK
jgi:hypothetical protein